MRISGHKTVEDWIELEKKLDTNNDELWNEAYDFFEARICTRYLKPIEAILNIKKDLGEGFAVVNLQCSLIETIESFINGWVSEFDEKKGKTIWKNRSSIAKLANGKNIDNTAIFISFFRNSKDFASSNIDGEDFFRNVRCGLLHETQTKKGWKINACSTGTENPIENKTIFREKFQEAIEEIIEKYKVAIIKNEKFNEIEGFDLRRNFIEKFNHICEISEAK